MGPIDLDGTTMLARGYESGNILAVEYQLSNLPDEDELETDLTRLLLLYQALIEARDQVEDDETEADDPSRPPRRGLEAKRYRWHWRAERTRSLAREAKRIHGTRCQVPTCGKELAEIYGDIAEHYIEAHHLTPFGRLDGRPTELDPETDFAVVCPRLPSNAPPPERAVHARRAERDDQRGVRVEARISVRAGRNACRHGQHRRRSPRALDRLVDRVPELDIAQRSVEWTTLDDGHEALLVDGGGIDGGDGVYFANAGEDVHAVGSLAPLIDGHIGCIVIRPDGSRVLARAVPDPLAQ